MKLQNSGLVLIGILILGIFGWWQTKSKQPVIEPKVITQPHIVVANVFTAGLYAALSGLSFLYPIFLQQLWGLSATQTGLAFLPLSIAITLISLVSGSWAKRWGNSAMLLIGGSLASWGIGLQVLLGIEPNWWLLTGSLAILGIGFGTFIPALSSMALDVSDNYSGMASGFNNAVSRIAGSLAVAIVGSMMIIFFRFELTNSQISRDIKDDLVSKSNQLLAIRQAESPYTPSTIFQINTSYIYSQRYLIGILGFSTQAITLCMWWYLRRLPQSLNS